MTVRTVTLTLPEHLYEQLETQARTAARSVDEVVLQTLARSLPPPVEDDLPPALRAELKAMEDLSDNSLALLQSRGHKLPSLEELRC